MCVSVCVCVCVSAPKPTFGGEKRRREEALEGRRGGGEEGRRWGGEEGRRCTYLFIMLIGSREIMVVVKQIMSIFYLRTQRSYAPACVCACACVLLYIVRACVCVRVSASGVWRSGM